MIIPSKLKKGDTILVIAPSKSLSLVNEDVLNIAIEKFESLNLKVIFEKNANNIDKFDTANIEDRINDFHNAFLDKNCKAIFCAIGGFNCNQIIPYIDWNIIKNNPKIICGFSDITVLLNAIYKKTKIVTYFGPLLATFGQKYHFDYTLEYVKKILMINKKKNINIIQSPYIYEGEFHKNQDNRMITANEQWLIINEGISEGTIIGGTLSSLVLLFGTEYMPKLNKNILLIEIPISMQPEQFDRFLESLTQQENFKTTKGILIGRFDKANNISNDLLINIIKNKSILNNIPIIANIDFGHTYPIAIFPIGGTCKLQAIKNQNTSIQISNF